jgi:apoptosis-inducing factor 2
MNTSAPQQPTVVIIGGGYGGVNAAKALDEHAQVTLIEPKDAFQHNVAALRALVDPAWTERIFLSYDHLLAHGTVVRDRAVRVESGRVELASGTVLTPDYIILATGSAYPFPAKADEPDSASSIAQYHALRADLAEAGRVLLLGAGAVGLELAGEIASAWPDKHVILVDQADEILPGGFDQRLRDELSRQLDAFGVEQVLGSALAAFPDTEPGRLKAFAVATVAGTPIEADIWFRCYGVVPETGYLTGDLAAARTENGYIEVTPRLEVVGFENVYAVGDIVTIDVDKASAAGRQAQVAAANIKARIEGGGEQVDYTPGPLSIVLPLGPDGGAGQLAGQDEIAGAEFAAKVKGREMMIGHFSALLNIPAAESD